MLQTSGCAGRLKGESHASVKYQTKEEKNGQDEKDRVSEREETVTWTDPWLSS